MKFTCSDRMVGMNGTATREIFKLLSRPEIISFAGGLPATEALPTAAVREICDDVLSSPEAYKILQYGTTEGIPALRHELALLAEDFGVHAADEDKNVLVVSGGQQGIDLVSKALLDAGDVVLVEDPTYLAGLQIFYSYQARAVGVRANADGLDIQDLEEKIRRYHPKLLYCVPTFSNPTGKCYTAENRREIARVTAKYGLAVLEDDPYARLRFSGEKVNALYAYAEDDNILYMASLSKILSPGLRVGGVIGNADVLRKMAIGKQGTDLHTSSLAQVIAAEYCRRGLLRPAVEASLPLYRSRKQAMQRSIDLYMPAEFEHTNPDGGLFFWGAFRGCDVDTAALLPQAAERNVAYIQGGVFFADGGGKNTIRLNFSNVTETQIETGIETLGEFFREQIAKE